MNYELPTSLNVDGIEHPIRSDYRAALDVCVALSDDTFSNNEKVISLLTIIYENPDELTNIEEAVEQALWFISCGDDNTPQRKRPKLMDWEQDFPLIVAPINRIVGGEIRAMEYMHWWTFVSYYYEIGDCAFANIIRIRDKKARGKKLEPHEKEFYRENRHLIDLKKSVVTEDEKDLIRKLIGGDAHG